MLSAAQIAEALGGKREGPTRWLCPCPLDGGHHLVINEKQGKVLIYSHGCGAKQSEILAILTERGLWESRNGHEDIPVKLPPSARVKEAEYRYVDENDKMVAVHVRYRVGTGKEFAWRLPNGEEKDGLGGMKVADLPLYGVEYVTRSDGPVLIVEGEKCVHACRKAGLTAVCGGGGAAQKEWGKSLEVLNGRKVILWPDNDAPGLALMQRLKSLLPDAVIIGPTGKAGGDAADFFAAGGTKEDVLSMASAVRTEPWVDEADSEYMVSVPYMGGVVRFSFTEPFEKSQDVSSEVTVWQEVPGQSPERLTRRLNVLSGSGLESLCRSLNEMHNSARGYWAPLVNRACSLFVEAWRAHDPSVDLSEVEPVLNVRYLVRPFVLEDGPTILFGRGGSAKTYFVLAMMLALAEGTQFLGQSVPERTCLFIDYESTKERTASRLTRLGGTEVLRRIKYWPGKGRSLAAMLSALERKVKKESIGFIAVDSALLACGGSPQDEALVGAYFGALQRLGLPSVTICHQPKDDKRGEDPFGSVYWTNTARITWNVQSSREAEENPKHIGLLNRKANEDMLHRPMGVRLSFTPERVELEREDFQVKTEDDTSLPERIRTLLKAGERSVSQLAEELDVSPLRVRKAVNQQMKDTVKRGPSPDGSNYWGLKDVRYD